MSRFLVIDDDPVIVKVLQSALQRAGHASFAASDAFDAMEKVRRERFDLIVCDVSLPGFSGYDLIAKIRADEALRAPPVLFLSGSAERKDLTSAMSGIANDYMLKPVDFDQFFDKVDGLLGKKLTRPSARKVVVSEVAKWSTALEIACITDDGLTFRSMIALPVGLMTRVEAEIFTTIGIDAPTLRVTSCSRDGARYSVHASFVGMSALEIQRLNRWITRQEPQGLRQAA